VPLDGEITSDWTGESGRFYAIDQSTDLQSWSRLPGSIPGNGAFREFGIPEIGPKGFFRIVVEP